MNAQVYRTKVSPYVAIPLGLAMTAFIAYIFVQQDWVDFTVALPILGFFVHLYYSTAYTITGQELRVRSGFLVDVTIDIQNITAIAQTHTVLSAPALSLDRIRIFYDQNDSIIISPPHQAEFIAALKAINPNIEVRMKEKSS